MIRNILASSPRKRTTALVATGALLALGGVLVTAASATAVTQDPAPAYNYSTLVSTNPAERGIVSASTPKFTLLDAGGKSVQVPGWVIQGTSTGTPVLAQTDPNNTGGANTVYGLFIYVPSTHSLVDVGTHAAVITPGAIVYVGPKPAYNATAATALLESLAPGAEYDIIVGQTPFAAGGAAGDPSVLAANEKYYKIPYQYNGKNPTSGVYESDVIGSTVNVTPVAPTATALTAVADGNGNIVLTATVQDPSNANATDSTASGSVTFHDATLGDFPASVSGGVATTILSAQTTLSYATTYTFTATYSGDANFATSVSSAQPATTSAAPAYFGQKVLNETVVVPAAGAGTLTLSVPVGAIVDFHQATPDLVTGKFTATAALPEATVTDTRYAKGDWTLNAFSSALTDGHSHSIPASALSWSQPTISTPTGSGAVAGAPATSLATVQSLANFHDLGTLLGQEITKVDTTLSLVAPINQVQGTYQGNLTVTLL